ncbi:lysozyme [Undibacterium sp. TJN25]|uniref:lysozyme n=1 Tax=Undibacterium sp. TJN25 TaxID=3413056 RepID=UPI003BEFA318
MNLDLKQKIAAAGLGMAVPLVIFFEGTRQQAYLDPVSIPTICRGHTEGVHLGQTATADQCDDMLAKDLLKADAEMRACVLVPLTDNQRAAFASFIFNAGSGNFCGSSMARKLNAGDLAGACNELPRWVYAGGKVLPGLIKRRAAEKELCLRKSG